MVIKERQMNIQFSVFTKSWTLPLPQLARLIRELGFDGIELPVRPGYQVEPGHVGRDLGPAVKVLADAGLKIFSIAGPTDEVTLAACARAGIPIVRDCENIAPGEKYWDAEMRIRMKYDALLPLLEKHGITLGIQNHYGDFIGHALGLLRLTAKYDPRRIALVWDPAHSVLNGESPERAAELLWDRVCMVNLKNGFFQRTSDSQAEYTQWRVNWTSARHGLTSWQHVAAELKKRKYQGVICLTAEYSDKNALKELIAGDIAYAQALLG